MNFTRILVLLLLPVYFTLPPNGAQAADFTVNSTDDDVDVSPGDGVCATAGGVCTLRAAIQESNALSGEDIIVLMADTYYLSIAGSGEDAAATGDLDITDNLVIKGKNSSKTIINGGALDRVFHIVAPVRVELVKLSIRNGSVLDNGAGVYNTGGVVSLVSCTVANNLSSGSGILEGGGICSSGSGSSLSIRSSSVINNAVVSDLAAAHGGGIAVIDHGVLNILKSEIVHNSAASAASVTAGGGICSINGGGITITKSKVLENTAISSSGTSVGGGVALINDDVAAVISRTRISMNSCTGTNTALGGGLYFEAETATVSSCKISDNRANEPGSGRGGGIAAFTSSTITIDGKSRIIRNLASFNGGGIMKSVSTVDVPDPVVAHNMPNDII